MQKRLSRIRFVVPAIYHFEVVFDDACRAFFPLFLPYSEVVDSASLLNTIRWMTLDGELKITHPCYHPSEKVPQMRITDQKETCFSQSFFSRHQELAYEPLSIRNEAAIRRGKRRFRVRVSGLLKLESFLEDLCGARAQGTTTFNRRCFPAATVTTATTITSDNTTLHSRPLDGFIGAVSKVHAASIIQGDSPACITGSVVIPIVQVYSLILFIQIPRALVIFVVYQILLSDLLESELS
mmetsp:Transcript_40703/g.66187  ORF Transcript_40703/g.66187 Transcript_40703/m.66187 type:complete len:239 (-) Transcript_40703:299-1015(-)